MNNIILLTDSYKVSHSKQYPPNTEYIYSYFESRGGRFRETVFYGLQYFLKNYLVGQVITEEKIMNAEKILSKHLPKDIFNSSKWYNLLKKYNGYLPIKIKAVPEGTPVGVRNVLMTVENTDPEFFWLTNYLETLLVQTWYPTTVATLSREIKKNIHKFLKETGSNDIDNTIAFGLNDFGVRGSTSPESAAIGGSAHLINFAGTDNIGALSLICEFYNSGVVGFSIPASEHSTMTSWGREHEVDAFSNMLDIYPSGLVACVSDSFDIYNACWELWGTELRDKILHRDGTLVIRPDSGNPPDVVLKVINILGERFGYTVNSLGFKILNPHVRIIQGDGVNYDSINEILTVLKENDWATENVCFGSGGALLQKMDRDTQKFAFKCSNAVIDGKDIEVFKNPITDPGKISKKGKLKLVKIGDEYDTQPEWSEANDELRTVFVNGELLIDDSFEQIRERARL
jgi:nicotinamide phosphoribosyltransferase